MTVSRLATAILVTLVVLAIDRVTVADQNMPLEAAVAKVNSEMRRYFADVDARRNEPLPGEKWPAPLTVDELLEEIREWQPDESEIAKAALPVFQQIADSALL